MYVTSINSQDGVSNTNFNGKFTNAIRNVFKTNSKKEQEALTKSLEGLAAAAAFGAGMYAINNKSTDDNAEMTQIKPKTKKIEIKFDNSLGWADVSVGGKTTDFMTFFKENAVECTTKDDIAQQKQCKVDSNGKVTDLDGKYVASYKAVSEESYKNGDSELIDFDAMRTPFGFKYIPMPDKFVMISDNTKINVRGTEYDLEPGTVLLNCKEGRLNTIKIINPNRFLAQYVPTENEKSQQIFEQIKKYGETNKSYDKSIFLAEHPHPELDEMIADIESKIVKREYHEGESRFDVDYEEGYDKDGHRIYNSFGYYSQYDGDKLICDFKVEKTSDGFVRFLSFINKYTYDADGNRINTETKNNTQW